jgi:hypothetical protein
MGVTVAYNEPTIDRVAPAEHKTEPSEKGCLLSALVLGVCHGLPDTPS